MELSIGDYVLSGGELAAMVRDRRGRPAAPRALGAEDGAAGRDVRRRTAGVSAVHAPAGFRGMGVPDILLSGNHEAIAKWRLEQRKKRTQQRRPDLWQAYLKRKRDLK